jgi:ATP-dependent Clp protease adaptor protein ClpS
MTTDIITEKNKLSSRDLKEPGKYKVIVCNDDVTPVEFVIVMLMSVFKHSEQTAVDLTMKVHQQGSAVAGVYSHEIAEQKCADATDLAKQNNFPLIIKVEAE